MSRFLQVALEEARQGKAEGGIPIGFPFSCIETRSSGAATTADDSDTWQDHNNESSSIGFKNDVWNPVGPFIRPFSSLSIRNECAVAL